MFPVKPATISSAMCVFVLRLCIKLESVTAIQLENNTGRQCIFISPLRHEFYGKTLAQVPQCLRDFITRPKTAKVSGGFDRTLRVNGTHWDSRLAPLSGKKLKNMEQIAAIWVIVNLYV